MMRKHVWIGRCADSDNSWPYEINEIKRGWDKETGWKDPLQTLCADAIEYDIGIKLKPGEVAKLELKLIRRTYGILK